MQHKFHFIYRTICTVSGRYYVGMHSTNDIEDGYLGSGDHVTRSMRKYGRSSHIREIIKFLPDRDALKKFEKEYITEEMLADPMCMNIAPGGGGGRKHGFRHSASTKAKIAEANRNRDAEVNRKISETLKGRKNPEHSVRQKGKFSNKENHPRTKLLKVESPSQEVFTFYGFEALHAFCKAQDISMNRLIKYRGAKVPSEKIQGAKMCSYNTVGWKLI